MVHVCIIYSYVRGWLDLMNTMLIECSQKLDQKASHRHSALALFLFKENQVRRWDTWEYSLVFPGGSPLTLWAHC